MDLNLVLISGKATRDAELYNTPSGQVKINFTIEVEQAGSPGGVTNFFLVDAFGGVAKEFADLVKKGRRLLIVGVLNKKRLIGRDGTKEQMIVIKAKRISVLPQDAKLCSSIVPERLREDKWSSSFIGEYIDAAKAVVSEWIERA